MKRVTHKEWAQSRAHAHLGLIKKKKDNRVRSRVFHDTEDQIKAMRQKADMQNPDEFYFGMHNSETKNERHRKTMELISSCENPLCDSNTKYKYNIINYKRICSIIY